MAPQVLTKRLALVTGAGQGNGRAIAIGLAKAGARVIITDINASGIAEVESQIRAAGGEAWAHVLDVTSVDACEALAKTISAEIGQVDVLVNNAGILIREGIDSPRVHANLQRMMDVNLNGAFNITHALLPALRATKGSIINIASIAAFAGQPGSMGYSPSKGAIKLLTQSLAIELGKDGIRVNAIAPGVIETAMTVDTRGTPAIINKFMLRTPMARVGQAEELVGPVVFLASDMASYITGVTLPVDGGFLAG
ncbi:SDR family oxidoreductase [Glaciimonas immobilis]|nr:SDR family oxidoreductase [Glaciimonas immobilis]